MPVRNCRCERGLDISLSPKSEFLKKMLNTCWLSRVFTHGFWVAGGYEASQPEAKFEYCYRQFLIKNDFTMISAS